MNYAACISASGAIAALNRQDVLSNNLANVGTAGFKPDIPLARQRAAERLEDARGDVPANEMLERLKSGVIIVPGAVDFTQGTLESTGNPLDLAIQGDGFFAVRESTPSGDAIRLTRDGRFTRSSEGTLVTTSGLPVLDDSNRPIAIPSGPAPTIDSDGTIWQGTASIARIKIADVSNRALLRKRGDGLFEPMDAGEVISGEGTIRQRVVERSGVDEIRAMLGISEAGRAVASNIAVMQQSDRLDERLINVFARVA